MINKITKEEKEQLIERRIEKINLDNRYARELFKTYYKDDPKENMKAWQTLEDKKKRKIVKQVIEWEDKAFLQQGRMQYEKCRCSDN